MNEIVLKNREWLQSDALKQQITQALPRTSGGPDRFLRCLFTQVQANPKIMQCSQTSIFWAAIKCAQVGIDPDGRRAHLIPFSNKGTMEVQLIIDYKGYVELAYRSGKVDNIHADVVCENDTFRHSKGRVTEHTFDLKKKRGEVIGAYAICSFSSGGEKAEILILDEIESVRRASRAGNNGPWKTHYAEMCKKTAARRLAKWLPLSPEERSIVEADDDQFEEVHRKAASFEALDISAHAPALEEDGDAAVEEEGGAE